MKIGVSASLGRRRWVPI